MSDFNPLDRAKIPTHRSSFDLSSKKLFTAKVGEILPCYWQIAIPGTKYRISSDWFTRTVPVNTAAYTRIKEYYDFYAVPLRLISRALPQAFTQMSDYMTSAASNSANTEQLFSVPYAPVGNISAEIQSRVTAGTVDDAGFGFAYGSCKTISFLPEGKDRVCSETVTGLSVCALFAPSATAPRTFNTHFLNSAAFGVRANIPISHAPSRL